MIVGRNLTLVLIAAALVLAGLGHYYLLYRDIYFRDAVVFYAVAALLLFLAYRRSKAVSEQGRTLLRSALRQAGAVLRGVLFRRPNRLLIGVLAVANGLAASISFLSPSLASPVLAALVVLLWAGGVAALILLVPWPRVAIGRGLAWLESLRKEIVKQGLAVPRFFLVIGLMSASLGQFHFFYQREHAQHLRNGVFFWCVAILSFGLLLWMEKGTQENRPCDRRNDGNEGSKGVVGMSDRTSDGPSPAAKAPGEAQGVRRDNRLPLWALVASLPLAILAQYILTYQPDAAWFGIAVYVVALGCLAGGLAHLHRRRLPLAWPAWTFLLVLMAAGLVGWAAYQAHVVPSPERNYRHAALFWMAGVALGVLVLGWREIWRRMPRLNRREAITVALLFAIALALRLVGLAQFPDVMSGDEGAFAMEARQIMQGDLLNPFGTGWFANATGYFYIQAVSLRVLGWNLFALRLPSAVFGALGVVAVYLLARETFGREVGWVSALFLAGWAFPLHFSRLGFSDIADPFLGAMTLGYLQRGLVRGRRGSFIAAGLMMGLSLYFYIGARLLVFIVLTTLFLSGTERLRRRWRELLVFALVALLVAGPLLFYFLQQPDKLFERHRVVGLFQSGQLATERQATGKPTWLLLLQHLGPAASVFIYTRDMGYFYRPAIPMLYLFSGALFVLGVGLALWHWREVRYRVLLAWVGLAVVFAGWLLNAPPFYNRYMVVVPAVCLLVGRAAVFVVRRAARLWGLRQVARRGLIILVAVVLMAVDAGYYFGVYARAGAFHWDRNTLIANRTARLMVEQGPDYTTYFFGTTYMPLGAFSSVVRLLAPEADWMDMLETPSDWSFVREGRGACFVVIPERTDDLPLLHEQFPGGEEWQVTARDGQLLFTVYRVDEADLQQPGQEGAIL